MKVLTVSPVGYEHAAEFVARFHYAVTMPSITKAHIGLWDGSTLVGVATWGYGTRPLHTIRGLFPSLGCEDYLELGRLCVGDEQPRNTESWFLSRCLYQNKMGEGRSEGMKCGKRPTNEGLAERGWKHYFGKQFRYAKFLCGHGERKMLLRSSTVKWANGYPKHADLEWKIWAGEGSRVSCEQPMFAGAVQFRNPAPLFQGSAPGSPAKKEGGR